MLFFTIFFLFFKTSISFISLVKSKANFESEQNLSLYVDNINPGYTRINKEYHSIWNQKKDIVVFGCFYSNEETLRNDYFQDVWYEEASNYEKFQEDNLKSQVMEANNSNNKNIMFRDQKPKSYDNNLANEFVSDIPNSYNNPDNPNNYNNSEYNNQPNYSQNNFNQQNNSPNFNPNYGLDDYKKEYDDNPYSDNWDNGNNRNNMNYNNSNYSDYRNNQNRGYNKNYNRNKKYNSNKRYNKNKKYKTFLSHVDKKMV